MPGRIGPESIGAGGPDEPEAAAPRAPARRRAVALALTAAASLLLVWPALRNGYPLVFMDTGLYVWSALSLRPSPAHPMGYPLLLRLGLAGGSPWLAIAIQSLATSALLVRVAYLLAPSPRKRVPTAVVAVAAVLLLSSAAKYASWLMPDVTTSWIFLGAALWLLGEGPVDRVAAGLAIGVSALCHDSHVALAVATGAIVAIAAVILRAGRRERALAGGLALCCLATLPASALLRRGFQQRGAVASGRAAFLMNRFIDSGVASQTLATYCTERRWKSCAWKEQFDAHAASGDDWFLFDVQTSPFWDGDRRVGRWEDPEYEEIVRAAFRCCLGRIVTSTLAATLGQLHTIDADDGLTRRTTRPMARLVSDALPDQVMPLALSRQRQGLAVATTLHPFPDAGLHGAMALLGLGVAFAAWRRRNAPAALMVGGAMAFLVANAAIVSLASTAHDRYQGRVAWLLAYTVAAAGAALLFGGRPTGRRGPRP